MTTKGALSIAASMIVAGCGNGGATGSGDVQLFLEAEGTITDGLEPGTAEENVVDGWTVSYSQFVIAIGDVRLGRSATAGEQHSAEILVIDLASLPASGTELATFGPIDAARWDLLGFATPAATAAAVRDESVPAVDYEAMIAGGCTYLVRGAITSPTGQSCPPGGACEAATAIDFDFCIPAATTFSSCTSPDGAPGLAVPAGGTVNGSITIHGDHLWFNAFPTGGEGTIERRAQWLADCDTNHDGLVDRAELEAIDAAALFTTARHYSLAGAPLAIDDAWDFVVAQVSTQGHFQGEGECVYAPAR